MNVFVDTSIVNNLLDLEGHRNSDPTWQENAKYLKLIIEGPVAAGKLRLYVNPSIKHQIDNTNCESRKKKLLSKFYELNFTEFNLTIFPFHFPAKFISEEQAICIQKLCEKHPALLSGNFPFEIQL